MTRHDFDDSPVAAKLQRFDLSGKALYKGYTNQIIVIIILLLLLLYTTFCSITKAIT